MPFIGASILSLLAEIPMPRGRRRVVVRNELLESIDLTLPQLKARAVRISKQLKTEMDSLCQFSGQMRN
jgi:hypothetical protein